MTDIFDTKILCKKCNVQMKKTIIEKEGMELRAVKCPDCGDRIIHPADINSSEHFNNLRGKTFHVKLRMVGNSHAISIPKEIVDFINEQHRHTQRTMDDMVRLCFEDFRKLSVMFDDEDEESDRRDEDYDELDGEEMDNDMEKLRIKKLRRANEERRF